MPSAMILSEADEPPIEISPEFAAELDRRLQECIDHPERLSTLDEIERELENELKS